MVTLLFICTDLKSQPVHSRLYRSFHEDPSSETSNRCLYEELSFGKRIRLAIISVDSFKVNMTDFYYTYPLPRFLFLHLCGILIGFRTDGNHQPVPISESRQDSAFCLTGCILFSFLLFHFNFYRSRFQTSSTYFYLHLPCSSFLSSDNSQCQTVERLPFSTLKRSE